MRMRAWAMAALGAAACGGAAAAEQRPALADVSIVRIANYGTPSTVITDRQHVNAIVGELRQLRGKSWRAADSKLSCYATLSLHRSTRNLTLFRISPAIVVERAPGKGQSSYSLAIGESDLPRIGALLGEIPPPKDCI